MMNGVCLLLSDNIIATAVLKLLLMKRIHSNFPIKTVHSLAWVNLGNGVLSFMWPELSLNQLLKRIKCQSVRIFKQGSQFGAGSYADHFLYTVMNSFTI